jgi:hypothetical protein
VLFKRHRSGKNILPRKSFLYNDMFERPVFVFVLFLRQTLKRARLA